MIQDSDLRDIENLIREMEKLEKQVADKGENISYLERMIKESKANYTKTNEQFREQIASVASSGRKNRAKGRSGKQGRSVMSNFEPLGPSDEPSVPQWMGQPEVQQALLKLQAILGPELQQCRTQSELLDAITEKQRDVDSTLEAAQTGMQHALAAGNKAPSPDASAAISLHKTAQERLEALGCDW
mmetsp:Transcript_2528/g.6032  ORF Transcript_2528/g.6032 Transcript_2528/m.6032 type:complete len:186 (-) Transcript_2528:86-643(-)